MPTPDTETLAARLRAVERALTDEATDPTAVDTTDDGRAPAVDLDDPDDRSRPDETDDPAARHGAGDPAADVPTDVQRRLRRLEAAVQALQAALGGDHRTPRADSTGPTRIQQCSRDDHPGQNGPDGDWPDDLAAE